MISNNIPDDPNLDLTTPFSQHHPCSTCNFNTINSASDPNETELFHKKDLHNLVKSCQLHRHLKTCYKYWKGPPELKEC
jgi:hypothetical protein